MKPRVPLIMAIALAAAGCGKDESRPKTFTSVCVRPVERAAQATLRRYSATVRAATQVDVAFKVGGYVEALLSLLGADRRLRVFQDGDRVGKGEALVTLRQADFAQKLEEARAALARAIAASEKAEIDFGRATKLVATAAVAQSELDSARAARDATKAEVEGDRARLAEAQIALGDSVLRAPIDGVILARSVEVGTLASPGAPAFSIADTSTVKVVFGVPDMVVASLQLGAPQRVAFEALRGAGEPGTITRISASADPHGHVFEVEVSVPNARGELRPGMVASLGIAEGGEATAPAAGGLPPHCPPGALIPLSAVVRAPGNPRGYAVFVLDDRAAPPTVHAREVELGDLLGVRVPVTSGLAEGDRIVVLGAGLLADGEAVGDAMTQPSNESARDDAIVATTHNSSRWFVENRNIAWALLIMTVVGGVFGYLRMPKAKDPFVEVRVAVAICPWPGAGAERIEELVTRRMEAAIAENQNLEKIESTTLENVSLVFVTLSERAKDRPRELDDLQDRLSSIHDLPQGAGPIRFLKDFGDTTTLMLTVASPPAGGVELELRARAIERAIEAVRGSASGATRAAIVVNYPSAIDPHLARSAAQLVGRALVEGGLARDERLIEGPSFIGIDCETSVTDEALGEALDAIMRERLHGSEMHPDVWRPAIVRDPKETLARISAVAGDRYSYRELDDFTDEIQRAMQTLPIVAKAARSGVLDERVFLEYSQERLASYGFQQTNLAQVLGARNIIVPGGEVEVGQKNVRIDPSGEFKSEAEIGDVMLASASGKPLYLRDLVDVVREYEGPPRYLNYLTARGPDGQLRRSRAITLSVYMRKNEQVGEFARQVDAKLAESKRVLPEDLILRRTSDQPRQVRENVALFMNSLYEAIVLIVLVALIGFWDWRSAAIMALSIPITLAMTFLAMYALGVDVQQVSIASLIIALGLLVDNPVVAGDAIKRSLADGRPSIVAAWLGPTKLATAILFATITNIAAYLPFLTLGGDTGKFLYTLPIVMTAALIASRIVATTFIPLLGYYLMRPAGSELSPAERRTKGFGGRYARVVRFAIEHRKAVFGFSLVVLASWIGLASRLKTAFFPHDLQYLSVVDVWLPEDAPLSATREKAFEADAVIRDIAGDALDSVTTFIGGGGPRFWFSIEPKMQQLNYAQLVVQLKDKEETAEFVRRVQPELSRRVAGTRIDVKQLDTAKPIEWPVAVRISGGDAEVLRGLAARLEADLRALPEADRVRDDWGYPAFSVKLEVDSDRANLAGVTNVDVALSSALAMNGVELSKLRDGRHMIPIAARLRASERSTLGDVEDLYVNSSATGRTVPLRQISRVTYGLETQKIRRRDQFRAITVSCFPADGKLPSETLAAAQPAIGRLRTALPPGYTLTIAGEFEEQQKGFGDLAISLLLSVAGIFLSLMFQFRSAVKPLVVFAAIVYGAAAALVALWIMHTPFGFMAFLGTISLIGVIVSHVIVLFDFIEEAHHMGEPLHEALIDAGIVRLRPVMITVAATVLGLFPLALHGGPLWEPLCYAQIGGLTVATFLTLLLVPVLYTIFVEDLGWITWQKVETVETKEAS